jgi:hypothetical protein
MRPAIQAKHYHQPLNSPLTGDPPEGCEPFKKSATNPA